MKKVAFIMGAGHSGSTLLDLILGSHPDAFSLGEFLSIPLKRKGGRYPKEICGICGEGCAFWGEIASLPEFQSYFEWGDSTHWFTARLYRHFGSFLCNIYQRLFEWTGAKVLVDSSKKVWWIRRQLRPFWFWQDITPFLIYLCRDGRAVVASYLRKYPERGVSALAQKWVQDTLDMEQYYQSFAKSRRLRVRYEELATAPERVIRSVCRALNVSYEPAMLHYWRHDHHIVSGNANTRSLLFRYREQFGHNLTERWEQVNVEVLGTGLGFYDQLGLAIRPDERWQHELSREQLAVFRSIAGKVNEAYAYSSER